MDVDPTTNFAYVANIGNNNVSVIRLTPVSNVTVSASPPTTGVSASYTVGFATSSSGTLVSATNINPSIDLIGPAGTSFPSTAANYSLSANNGHTASVSSVTLSAAGGSSSSNEATLTLSGSTIVAGDSVTLSISGVVNPPAGSQTLSVLTSGDTQAASSAPYAIQSPTSGGSPPGSTTSPTQVSNVTVSPNPATPAVRATYTVGFTTSSSGALGPGSTITLVAPNGTDFLGVLGDYSVTATNGHGAVVSNVGTGQANGSSSNNELVLTLGSSSIAAGDRVTLTIQSVLNPAAGSYTATLATSADTIAATSASYSITATGSTPTPTPTPTRTPTPTCATATYLPGWNLVGGPTGTVLNGAVLPLYTHQATDPASGSLFYETLNSNVVLNGANNAPTAAEGFWAFYFSATTVNQPCVTGASVSVTLPANNYVMVGNPFNRTVSISASTSTFALPFNTSSNSYGSFVQIGAGQSLQLAIGQGVFVISSTGGTVTLN